MTWLYGLLCLFFLIIFHEFGHFVAAKVFGVKVESFSVGFGPVLFHKTIKGTDYRLSLLPLGGYCGMKGEKDFQKAIENKLPTIEADKDSLYGVHPVKRILIGFAGPFFNFIFAFIAFSIIAGVGYKYFTYSNQVIVDSNKIEGISTVALDGGIKTGDKIIKNNNKKISDFAEIIETISLLPDEDITILVNRNGNEITFNLHTDLDKETGAGKLGIIADTSNVIEKEISGLSFFYALKKGFVDTLSSIKATFKSIGLLFKGVNLDNAVSGPLRVTDMLGSTVQNGFEYGFKQGLVSILSLMSIISISLFIMNLLPIPILDGGIILIALIEIIFRKKINPRVQYYVQFIGLAFIIILFIIGLKGDLKFFLGRGN